MTTTAFDTLEMVHLLQEKAGFTPQQAEGTVIAFASAMKDSVATKGDVEALRKDLKADIQNLRKDMEVLRQDTKADIESLRKDTKADIESLRKDTKTGFELLRQENKGERLVMRWILSVNIGVLLSGFAAIFFKLYFG